MKKPIVACLVVTNRPEWMPFCYHQIEKQVGEFDKRTIVVAGEGSIPEKRNEALARARGEGCDYFAWFDDDDWSSPERLFCAHRDLYTLPHLSAVGSGRAWFCDPKTSMGTRYQAPEGIIFNGAVFRRDALAQDFRRGLHVGEDTDWLTRWQARRANYLITGADSHVWLCHERNVTNRLGVRAFDQAVPAFLSEAEARLIP